MASIRPEQIQIGDQAFFEEGGEEFGAVREVSPEAREIVIYVENAGDFTVPLAAIVAVHSQKVIVDRAQLQDDVREAIARAHDAEEPGF